MTTKLRALAARFTVDAVGGLFRDLIFLAGLGVVGYGINLVYTPAAVIYAGLAMAALAFFTTPKPNEPTQ